MKTTILLITVLLFGVVAQGQTLDTKALHLPAVCSDVGITLPKCPEITVNWARNFAHVPDVDGNERQVDLGFRSDGSVIWRLGDKPKYAHAPQKKEEPEQQAHAPLTPAEKIYHVSVEGTAEVLEYQQEINKLQEQINSLQNAQAFWRQKQQTVFALEGVPKSELGRRWDLGGPNKTVALYPPLPTPKPAP